VQSYPAQVSTNEATVAGHHAITFSLCMVQAINEKCELQHASGRTS